MTLAEELRGASAPLQQMEEPMTDKLYDLAFFGDLLVACVPHGADIMDAVRSECRTAGLDFEEPTIITRVALTDSPDEADEVVYSGTRMGWLTDESGRSYQYAVQR